MNTKLAKMLIVLVVALLAVGCTQSQAAPPAGFERVAAVDLAAEAHDAAVVGQFTVTESAEISLTYTMPNINVDYFDLSLRGPDGDSVVILHSERLRTDDSGGGDWAHSLTPGDYELLLTAPQTTGTLSIYWQQQAQ